MGSPRPSLATHLMAGIIKGNKSSRHRSLFIVIMATSQKPVVLKQRKIDAMFNPAMTRNSAADPSERSSSSQPSRDNSLRRSARQSERPPICLREEALSDSDSVPSSDDAGPESDTENYFTSASSDTSAGKEHKNSILCVCVCVCVCACVRAPPMNWPFRQRSSW